MARTRHLYPLVFLVFTCSALANVELKVKESDPTNGQKRLDIHASKWAEAQTAINSLIDESISNEVVKAKMEVKALLEKNIAKHLHEASNKVMQSRLSENIDIEPLKQLADHVHHDTQGSNVCQDKFDNCGDLAASGVCDTSREAMRKHCARTCELCHDEDLPPAAPAHKRPASSDTWTIIGADGEKFTTSIKDIQSGTRKASITSSQVEQLLKYVKNNAPHLKLKKVKPGVLKLIRIPEKKHPAPHKITLKKEHDKPEKVETPKVEPKKDIHHDNYWTMKEDKQAVEVKHTPPKQEPKAKEPMIHFDLSSIVKNKDLVEKEIHVMKDEALHEPSTAVVHHTTSSKSEEYLKHICHPMCKKTCISSCAPGCCAGEHHKDFPLYHRKSSHCHPFCKKHCISSCPLTCCAGVEKVFKTWKHPHTHHIANPGCHPMCKKNCVPSCPKACCAPKKAVHKSHCHPLCKKTCLSSCPLSCCNKKDRQKEKCHPLCRKTCLPSCPNECCLKKASEHKLIMKSSKHESRVKAVAHVQPAQRTCPGLCPDSCAPACHSGCCGSKKMELSRSKPLIHAVPSGCTANCVYECIPGCPPACCQKREVETPEVSRYTYQQPEGEASSETVPATAFSFPQPIVAPYAVVQPQPPLPIYPQEQMQSMYGEDPQSVNKNVQSPSTESRLVSADSVRQSQAESTSLFSPKHCPASCLTHCSPECVRSDCCDLDK